MVEAERLWQLRKTKFQTAFRYQYVISKTKLDIYSFQTATLNNWHISYGQALPFHLIYDNTGNWVGVLLGIAVAKGGLVQKMLELDIAASEPDFFEKFELLLKDFAGRYAVFLSFGNNTRYYCDPVGMIGAVYEKEHQRIGSSPLLTIDRPVMPHLLYDHEKMEKLKGKYSIFHTRDAHIRRLNPNCYLDMETFAENRFWPKDEIFAASTGEYLDIMDEIASTTKFNMEQIAGAYPTALPLTGGQDSRLLATMAGDAIGKVDQIYTHVNKWVNTVDADIGAKIASELGQNHQVHAKGDQQFSKRDVVHFNRMYSLAIGYPATIPPEFANGNVKHIKPDAVILRGHQTDLLRAVFVRKRKEKWTDFNWQLERLLILPRDQFDRDLADRFRPDYRNWYDSLPSNAKEKSVDFMFLEIYYSSTVGATFPGLWRNFYMSPYNSRRLIELSLKFDEEFRKNSLPVFCINQLQNPKVAEIYYDFDYMSKETRPDGETSIKLCNERAAKRTVRIDKLIDSLGNAKLVKPK